MLVFNLSRTCLYKVTIHSTHFPCNIDVCFSPLQIERPIRNINLYPLKKNTQDVRNLVVRYTYTRNKVTLLFSIPQKLLAAFHVTTAFPSDLWKLYKTGKSKQGCFYPL